MTKSSDRSVKQGRVIESFQHGELTFVAEQDGPVERDFEARLVERLRNEPAVTEAYLVRVRYGSSLDLKVLLGLRAGEAERSELLEMIASEFRTTFKTTECLDILFLSPGQQREINRVAKPFYKHG